MVADDAVEIDVDAWQGSACAGVVVGAGERARVLAGKRVLVGTADPCGECDVCRRGGAPVCPHARPRVRGKRTTADARWLVALADGLELPLPAAAAVPGDIALAYTMYARTSLAPHDTVVIAGESPVASWLAAILGAKGITPVIAAAGDDRAGVAGAVAAQGASTRPWRVLATTREAAARAAELCGPRATLTLLAPTDPLDPALVANEVVVVGVAREHPDLIVEVAAMCAKGELDLAAGTTTEPGHPTRSYLEIT